jgi:D-alanyl-D-alanine dipeptidase
MISLFNFPLVLQLLVVIAHDWSSVEGTLYRYQRSSSTLQWELSGPPIEVTLGKQGMAWGKGLCDFSDQNRLGKKEGDGKSPAGIFYLGPVFGNASHQPYAKNMPFLLITDDLEYVDDSHSLYYNQFVTAHSTKNRDWKSSEKMKEIGSLYALGFVVQHNLNPIEAGMGSAIFMHIWRSRGMGTAGCTAMAENDLNEIVLWLNAEQHPCLVQLPLEEYLNKKSQWGLPELPSYVIQTARANCKTSRPRKIDDFGPVCRGRNATRTPLPRTYSRE